ncbi:MAG: mycofactocin biosynthesis chaperone MftB [Deltaproteobacteria bacterium]|nr:mycofactocin biosynthesis chaperone MftB [Deltaproteobacteria bacterium]
MTALSETRYRLSSGAQVREEDFGLLFYAMKGPRLFFLSCGSLLDPSFFQGEMSLDQWIKARGKAGLPSEKAIKALEGSLSQLKEKGVIFEC